MIDCEPISGEFLTIDGVNIREIVSYKVQQAKLWKDANRNMNGVVKATLIGVFPKIELEFAYMSRSRASEVASRLNKAYFDVTYYDPGTGNVRTAQYYAGDFTVELLNTQTGYVKPFDVNLIPVAPK